LVQIHQKQSYKNQVVNLWNRKTYPSSLQAVLNSKNHLRYPK